MRPAALAHCWTSAASQTSGDPAMLAAILTKHAERAQRAQRAERTNRGLDFAAKDLPTHHS